MLNQLWKDYFTFSRKERTALIIILFLIVVVMILPSFFPAQQMNMKIDAQLQQQLDSITQQESYHQKNFIDSVPDSSNKKIQNVQLFSFDPNTLDERGFLKLGLNAKVVHTIISYRNKGGYFKSGQDIKKIYGLSNADAERLMPYVQISSNKNLTIPFTQKETQPTTKTDVSTNNSNKIYHTININTATADEWKTLPGIGDVLGNRIVKFRNSMHGFKSVDDVKKTYGLNDSTFNLIRPYLTMQ